MMAREFTEYEDELDDDVLPGRRRQTGVRVKLRGGMPRSRGGKIALIAGLLGMLGLCLGVGWMARNAILHDERFMIPSATAIETTGNSHVTRAQLVSLFGEDIERNIFRVPLEQRRAELEELPWVQHAMVMRLLPNRLRVAVVERTPVAFVRQGNRIGLVDANGILLDMPTDAQGNTHYSFPVVTGLTAKDPLSLRAARMKIYERFMGELDGSGEKVSEKMSEVDLSDPEDVRAAIQDKGGEVMVHFGEENFLDRYKKFEDHLPEWRQQYPHLASVDMRYDRQVVLEMQPGTAAPVVGEQTETAAGQSNTVVKTPPSAHTSAPSHSAAAVKKKRPAAKAPAKGKKSSNGRAELERPVMPVSAMEGIRSKSVVVVAGQGLRQEVRSFSPQVVYS
jgi:cell division protein FtsQ